MRVLTGDDRKINRTGGPGLTAREREVLRLLAGGLAAKEIARYLNMSVKAVETHRRHMMEKFDMQSPDELRKYAVREWLVSIEDSAQG
jgi:DNA-binding CsgD family transcriptional regulator